MQKHFYLFALLFVLLGTATAQQVRMVSDIKEGNTSTFGTNITSLNRIITVIDDIALFSFSNPDAEEWQMWRSDGTEEGTYSVLSAGGMVLRGYEITEDAVYAWGNSSGESRLYKTGTEATDGVTLADFDEDIYNLTYFEDALYFGVGFGSFSNAKLMKYDLVTDELTEMMSLGGDGGVIDIEVFQNQLLFVIKNGNSTANLYLSDGTIAGTNSYYDFSENYHSSYSKAYLTTDENNAFFFYRAANGAYRLFVTDGTAASTVNVANYVYHTWNNNDDHETRRAVTTFDGKFFFRGFVSGEGANDAKLYVTDGTPGAVTVLEDIAPGGGYNPNFFTHYDGKLFFAANTNGNKTEIYTTDGTLESTVVEINGDELGSGNSFGGSYMRVFNDSLAFQAYRGETGTELWLSNGTTEGTNALDVLPFSNDIEPIHLMPGDNLLFFAANDGVHGFELWVYDPNEILPQPIAAPVAAFGSSVQDLAVTLTNNTTGEVTDFAWDFGDGNTSTEENPVHTYSAEGTYNVCLTATGEGGSDIVCAEITVMTTGVDNFNLQNQGLNIYPNPASSKVTLTSDDSFSPERVLLLDMLGRAYPVKMSNTNEKIEIFLPNISRGEYILQLLDGNGKSKFGTVVIQ